MHEGVALRGGSEEPADGGAGQDGSGGGECHVAAVDEVERQVGHGGVEGGGEEEP